MIPYISKLTQEELNELAQKGTDSSYILEFIFKLKSLLDFEMLFEASGIAIIIFEKRIEAIKFTPSERIALIIMLCK